MSDETLLKRIRDAHDMLAEQQARAPVDESFRIARQMTEALRTKEESLGIQHLRRIAEEHDAVIRAALGPLHELRLAGIVGDAYARDMELTKQTVASFSEQYRGEMEQARQAMLSLAEQHRQDMEQSRLGIANLQTLYRLPDKREIAQMAAAIASLSGTFKSADAGPGLREAMESMRTPWIDVQDTTRSIAGFAELQGIGHAIGSMPAFDDALAAGLRIDLGDWRDRIAWPQEIFTDLPARSEFYARLGFDRALTDFPPPAFRESLTIAGLRHTPPPLADRYGEPVPHSADREQEKSLKRTNKAHDWLQRLETQLRKFIDEKMIAAFGADWPKRQLPKGLYEKWQEKKDKARSHGAADIPLIAYADFTDYELVICRTDNWRDVFASFFKRQESVRESFQRLYPLRLDTMHARRITQDDELFLYVETKRLVKVIL